MRHRHNVRRVVARGLLAGILVCLSVRAACMPGSIDSLWVLEEEPCIRTGDVPVCEASVMSEEWMAIGQVHVIANQDSPLFGRPSHGEHHIRFQRTFSVETEISVVISAEVSGILRIESGRGEATIRASAVLVDAITARPATGTDALPIALYFNESTENLGTLTLQNSGSRTTLLAVGTYILVCEIETSTGMAVGWFNYETEADVTMRIELSVGSEQAIALNEEPCAIPDYIVVPLGVEGTSYAHLEPGVCGGMFTASALGDPSGWNAVTAHDVYTTRFTNILMQGLLDIDPNTGMLVPELARSWDVSEDGLEILIPLRRGLQWSDGAPFTVDDVLFTFNDLYFNSDIETDVRDRLRLPDGAFPAFEKVDDSTIRIVLTVPYRPLLDALRANIMPKHVLADFVHKLNPAVPPGTFNSVWTLDTNPSKIVGMGPFVLAGFSRGQTLAMKRNPYYYHFDPNGVRLPYVDTYVVQWFQGQRSLLLEFRSRKMDAFVPPSGDTFALQRTAVERGLTVVVDTTLSVPGTSWICINQDIGLAQGTDENLRALFRDLRFRKAVAHAIDKESIIVNAYGGMAVPQWSPVPMASPYYAGRSEFCGPITEQDSVAYDFDLQQTMALLDEIGVIDRNGDGWRDFEDGTPVNIMLNTATRIDSPDFSTPLRDRICAFLAEDLRAAGLHVSFLSLDFKNLVEKLHASSYQMVLLGLDGSLDPATEATVYHSSGDMHFWHNSANEGDGYSTETTIDALLSRGASTFDESAAFEAYKQFQIAFSRDDLGLIFTVSPAFVYAYYNDIGNAEIANPIANPSGDNGLTMDLIFLRPN